MPFGTLPVGPPAAPSGAAALQVHDIEPDGQEVPLETELSMEDEEAGVPRGGTDIYSLVILEAEARGPGMDRAGSP